ncbi:MAG: c-type cytochrome biogenesis protein CcmI [Rhodopseudomonas sp.]|uniref:c-type cytochrome biogenesis protein CcmI n=1 Tax=Rhodopseudomonas sp. TaxID=1078 RepID=UPI0017CEF214|nr:c-type cytochrome biogenesis protein CcmI [Rhodopseudomonas sp.]NVN86991.1 c-type cytochrome biogenesis protein CcmI [Rhodopseudomonas sp.]
MTLWFVFAMMTAAAAFAVLWPLSRGLRAQREGSEANVYKDQLAEVERDAASGLIEPPEASAARVEISRRLIASADAERAPPTSSRKGLRRAVAVLALLGLPAMAVALYLPLGSPQLADAPLAQRAKAPTTAQPLENLVAQVEAHLEKNPADGRGWSVLAPVLAKLGRFDDAARAYRNAIAYSGDSAERRADLGEILTMAAGGVITADAKAEFERALALNADEVKSRYFMGLAAEQDGRAKDAASIWRAMLEKAPADAPWRPMLQAALARVGGAKVPALPDDKVAAAKDMTATDRDAMIRGMVDRLATRLKQNGDDVEGWLRLVRAYMVLGDADKAKGALAQARQAVGGNADTLRRLNEGLKDLGLDG